MFESGEKTVNVVSGGAGVHGPLVFQDLLHDELAELFNVVESNTMPARKSVRQPGEYVVQLREFGNEKNPKCFNQHTICYQNLFCFLAFN